MANKPSPQVKEPADTTAKKLGKPFQPGDAWQGNKLGRPKSSRNKLSEGFISALSDDFETHGVSVIETVRTEKPADYLKIIAAIVPKELHVNTAALEEMSDDELLERLDEIRSVAALLNAGTAGKGTSPARGDKAARGQPH